MRDKILEMLKEIAPDSDFEGSRDFFTDELVDSFGTITMVTMLEEMFAIRIEADDITADNFMNLEAIEALMNKYVGQE